MIVRTEYSFRRAFGSVEAALARLPRGGIIADDGCWGHVAWSKACKDAKKLSGLGVRLRIAEAAEGRGGWREIVVVPTSAQGLKDLYSLVTLANAQFHHWPRLRPSQIGAGDWAIIATPGRVEGAPELPPGVLRPFVPGALIGRELAFSDNFYPSPEDRRAWAFSLGGQAYTSMAVAHILSETELRIEGAPPEAIEGSRKLLEAAASVVPPKAENIRFPVADAMRELDSMCRAEMIRRGLADRTEYEERYKREIDLVAEKGFADYFLVIADMIAWAKLRMLVGPGRGSSAGSLLCWLLRITEVDPLVHGLLFERFIDANRFDLPDIDIDFPDSGRASVLEYLAAKYGQAQVAHIGTVMRYKPKSALTDVAKQLRIPDWELKGLKDTIIERSSGDSRVNDCLRDTVSASTVGQALLKKYPDMDVAFDLEGRCRQTGTHAAGMIICNRPVEEFCSIGRERVAQIDKKAATELNILKIDALGLRNLSILDTACELVGKNRDFLYDLPLDDPMVFKVFNQRRFTGIFQFEGYALQSLASQITFREFNDIAALTALARPGPLGGGEATHWVERHEGREEPRPPHPILEDVCRETFGTILYQEQVMVVTRKLGNFSWKDTAAIRKLMSDRKGEESFRKFEDQFMRGAIGNGVSHEDATKIWKAINSFGSWAFNKSHAVVYGLVSYWCAWMKAHHPLEFACACLRHNRGDDAALLYLRELSRDGVGYVAFDPEKSVEDWAVIDGKLTGGLLGIPGIGEKTAKAIMNRRTNGLALTPGQQKLLSRESVFVSAFPTRKKWGHIYANPAQHNIRMAPLVEIAEADGHVVVIGKLLKKAPRDMNDDRFLEKRKGVRLEGTDLTMLIMHIGDDSGRLIAIVDRFKYKDYGAKIADEGIVGKTWLMVRGRVNDARFLNVEAVRWLE